MDKLNVIHVFYFVNVLLSSCDLIKRQHIQTHQDSVVSKHVSNIVLFRMSWHHEGIPQSGELHLINLHSILMIRFNVAHVNSGNLASHWCG